MDGGTVNLDPVLRARLTAALEPRGGTATQSILETAEQEAGKTTPANQIKQSKRKHDAPQGVLSTRDRGADRKTYIVIDSDEDDDISTTDLPPKRARFTKATQSHPKNNPATQRTAPQQLVNKHQANEHPAPQQPSTQQQLNKPPAIPFPVNEYPAFQGPAPQHRASQYPASRFQHTETQKPALISQQIPPAPQQRLPSAPRPTSPLPLQDAHEQSRQINRILTCPSDAYFDILSLANRTDRASLVETSWLDLSYLLHPRRCSLPDSVKALSRVNDAYSWIQKHPGLAQPVPHSPPPPVAQDASSTPRASHSSPNPRGHTIMQSQQSWDNPGTDIIPPPRTFRPKPSAHIYVSNGNPTIRPVVGWQFWELGGETRVWWDGRWRTLLQSRPNFRGLYVDENRWIMPRMSGKISSRQQRRIAEQAMFEFNSHP